MLELGEDLLDGVEVWRVFGQEEELCAGLTNELAHSQALMTTQVVHHDDVAGSQGGDQNILDIGSKGLAIDGAIEKPRRVDPIMAQSGQKGRRCPVTVWHLGDQPDAARAPAPQWRHVGLGPGFIDENQTCRINSILVLDPLRPPPRHVATIALASHHGFF